MVKDVNHVIGVILQKVAGMVGGKFSIGMLSESGCFGV